jgi:ABC-type nitrate/sulfonate/bicarbonate transport system ATPase subunit
VTGGAAIRVQGVSHSFTGPPPVEALLDVDLAVERGAFVALIGPSGCGKSTLLRMLAGLVVPTAGAVFVGDTPAAGVPGLVAFQPQRDLLMPWRRVLGNAILGAEVAGVPVEEARREALGLFGAFGLEGFEDAWPARLSGGMRQRVALLRTFLVPRPALLLDEPFGALDALTRRDMQVWLEGVWRADGRTVLLVTHDVEEALLLADRVAVMSARPGRIVHDEAVPFARPRAITLVTTPEFVACKRRLLDALAA